MLLLSSRPCFPSVITVMMLVIAGLGMELCHHELVPSQPRLSILSFSFVSCCAAVSAHIDSLAVTESAQTCPSELNTLNSQMLVRIAAPDSAGLTPCARLRVSRHSAVWLMRR